MPEASPPGPPRASERSREPVRRPVSPRYTPDKMPTSRVWVVIVAFCARGRAGSARARRAGNRCRPARARRPKRPGAPGGTTRSRDSRRRHPTDEPLAVLRARVVAAHGDYARAEALLQPIVAANARWRCRARDSGLLQLTVGRRTEARRTLQLVLLSDLRNPVGARLRPRRARGARPRAASRTPTASSAKPVALAPTDAAANTAWGELFLEKYNRRTRRNRSRPPSRPTPDMARRCWAWPARWRTTTRPQAVQFAASRR